MLTKEECLEALRTLIPRGGNDGELMYWSFAFLYEFKILMDLINDHFEMIDQLKTGDLSDGYHTFNELYHHRAVLFSVIVNQNKEIAWKSKKHHDGTMYDGMFIVGVDTPQGQYSYHYDLNLWDLFDVKELENAPEWDGHKPQDIVRLQSLNDNPPLKFEEIKEGMFI